MPASLRLAIADDAQQLRQSFLRRLALFPDVTIVASEPSGDRLLRALEAMPPDCTPHVVLMDIEMDGMDGIETTRRVCELWPGLAVVMLTVFEDEDKLLRALEAGACGYLLKDEPIDRIVAALYDAVEGRSPFSPSAAATLIGRVRLEERQRRSEAQQRASAGLTSRECDVLRLLAQGHTDTSAAAHLFVSAHTVQSHTKSMYRKLGVHSRAEAVRVAAEIGLLSVTRTSPDLFVTGEIILRRSFCCS